MALVLAALMLAALCGVQTASIPSSLETMLDHKFNSQLDDKLDDKSDMKDNHSLDSAARRSVLEDMKRLLDFQLASLLEEGEGRTGKKDTSSETPREAEDQLLQVNKDNVAQFVDKDEAFVTKNTDHLNNIVTQNNNEDIINELMNDIGILPDAITNNEDIQKGKSNRKKGISHVIKEYVPKTNKNDENIENIENVLDLDEILKAAIKDTSGSLSLEDKNNEFSVNKDGTMIGKNSNNNNALSVTDMKTPIFNHTQVENPVKELDDSEFKVYKSRNIHKDGIAPEKEKPHIGQRNIHRYNVPHLRSGEKYIDYIINQPKLHHISRNHKANHKINYIKQATGKEETIKMEHDKKEEKYHRQYSDEGSEQKSGNRDKPNTTLEHRYLDGEEHMSNKNNKNYDSVREDNQPIIIKLISDSDGTNESEFDVIQDEKNANTNTRSGDQNHDSTTSKESEPSNVNLYQENDHVINVSENALQVKESNSDVKEIYGNNIAKDNKFSSQDNHDLMSRISIDNQETNGNPIHITPETRQKYEDKINSDNHENIIILDREKIYPDESDVNDNKNETGNKNVHLKIAEATEAKESSDEKVNITNDNEIQIRMDKHSKKENRQGIKRNTIFRNIFDNKNLKKSYSLSLTLNAKEN